MLEDSSRWSSLIDLGSSWVDLVLVRCRARASSVRTRKWLLRSWLWNHLESDDDARRGLSFVENTPGDAKMRGSRREM